MTERSGYVYVYGGKGTYKIGHSRNPQRRIREFSVLPFAGELVLTIASEAPATLERHLHRHFEAKRVRGEWFRLNKSDLVAIPKIAETAPPAPVPQPKAESSKKLDWPEPEGPIHPYIGTPKESDFIRVRFLVTEVLGELTALTGHVPTHREIEKAAQLPPGAFARWAAQGYMTAKERHLLTGYLNDQGLEWEVIHAYIGHEKTSKWWERSRDRDERKKRAAERRTARKQAKQAEEATP